MDWTWDWLPYDTTASFGDNPLFDWLRVLCLVVGIVLAFAIGRVLIEGKRRPVEMASSQAARFVALALADIYISFTEFAVFGTPATPRLPLGVAALAIAVYGVRGMRRKQRATPPIR